MKRKQAASEGPSVNYCMTGQNGREISVCIANSLYLNFRYWLLSEKPTKACHILKQMLDVNILYIQVCLVVRK
jgi:hypothetical protein